MDSTRKLTSSRSGHSERRRSKRYALETNGTSLDTGSGESRGMVVNLCEGGMAVHTRMQVEPGSIQHLKWELHHEAVPFEIGGAVLRGHTERIETEGVIVWVDKEHERIGIKFQNLSEQRNVCHWAKHHSLANPSPPLPNPSSPLPDSQLTQQLRETLQTKPDPDASLGPPSTDSKAFVPVPPGAGMIPRIQRGGRSWSLAAIVALIALAFLGVGAYWGGHAGGLGFGTAPMLRLAGSNTIGGKLAPALAQAFLQQLGAKDIRILLGAKGDEEAVQGVLPGSYSPVQIQIAAHGSATAFQNLMNVSCDIVMASRKIKPEEISELSSLGDLSSRASEHVLGLDAIAVIVSSSNPVQTLTTGQLAQIFSGTVVNWSQVSSQHGTINVYARDDKSGAYDTFQTLVLGSKQLVGTATRLEDSRALSDAVAGDPNGIGFIGLPYILSAKVIAVAERGATPLQPNRLTVGTEDYPLSQRLYLYTPANPQNSYVRKFVEFALSKAGQEVVGDAGFVPQNVTSVQDVISISAPFQYRRLTQGAGRLSLDFRFLPDRTDLDNTDLDGKALMDLDRVASFLADSGYNGNNVMLLGFTDSGNRHANITSQIRARIVAEEFAQRGLKPATVKGFGSDLPVGSNYNDAGRERNRRVEIWLKK